MRRSDTCSLIVTPNQLPAAKLDIKTDVSTEHAAVLAGGCFWCVEAVYKSIEGVHTVRSGYTGGTADTADYRTVCSGTTDHAEAIEIRYDASKTSYGELLRIFFAIAHDPTQLDGQGADIGRQYRSAIFYADEKQKKVAEAYIEQIEEAGVFNAPIVTTLEPLETFYEAEEYHQDYAERNPNQAYIAYNAAPKVNKLREFFGDKIAD